MMTPLERLSPTERQTAALVYAGWTVRQIADGRHCGVRLIELQLISIYHKLHINDTQQLAEIYRRGTDDRQRRS